MRPHMICIRKEFVLKNLINQNSKKIVKMNLPANLHLYENDEPHTLQVDAFVV